eukprot:1338039-Amphidinium_carterae.1
MAIKPLAKLQLIAFWCFSCAALDELCNASNVTGCVEFNIFFTAELRGLFTPVNWWCNICDPDDSEDCYGGHARRLSFIRDQRAVLGSSMVFVSFGGDGFGGPFEDHPDYPAGAVAAEMTNALDYDF